MDLSKKIAEVRAFLDGKKTYLTVAATFVVAGLEAVGVSIPHEVYVVLGALGVGFLRSGVNKV